MSRYAVTTAIPYVNAKPHMGHALEFVQADAFARLHRLLGDETILLSGADENALKNVQAAEKEGIPVQQLLDKYAQAFRDLAEMLTVQIDVFQRGSDRVKHWPGVQMFWQRCIASGDIYKKQYVGLYCVGCEAYYTPDELVNGQCPLHLREPERVEEENYFFALSRYESAIRRLIESDEVRILPAFRKNEMLAFLDRGLEDFSVSRSVARARGVGVPVPNDPSQVMYVWFDALNIYMTGLGYGQADQSLWERMWPVDVHIVGKDIVRFHAIYWIGMLLSAQLPLPRRILVHGFITSGGQKMSKSLGNVVDPVDFVQRYGVDALRYYLVREIPTQDDGDFTPQRFHEVYTAELANALGNTASRIAKLCATRSFVQNHVSTPEWDTEFLQRVAEAYDLRTALVEGPLRELQSLEKTIADEKPWEKSDEEIQPLLSIYVERLRRIAWHLQPVIPSTAERLLRHFGQPTVAALEPLFPRVAL